MRLVFVGTPEFAVPSLQALVAAGHEVAAVVTRPDKPTGRGRKLTAPPVKEAAEKLGLNVLQPRRVNSAEFVQELKSLNPDALVVAAFGAILRQPLLDLAPGGAINVHASMLPAYRGVAPANWCLVHGVRVTGVTIMQMDAGVDTGAVLQTQPMEVGPHETAGDLLGRMSQTGAELLVDTLKDMSMGAVTPKAQPEEGASYAPSLEKSHGYLNLLGPSQEVYSQYRGVTPAPGARVFLDDVPLLVTAMRPVDDASGRPYEIIELGKRHIRVGCGHGAIDLLTLRSPGKGDMDAAAFARGRNLKPGDRFSPPPIIPDLDLRVVVPQ